MAASINGHPRAGADTRSTLDSIRRIVQVLRLSSRAAQKRVGLSGAQLFVLHRLDAGDAPSLNELAERTLTHQSSVSVVVQKLVDRRLVSRTRSRNDARRIELHLTAAGRHLLARAPEAAQERLVEALQSLPPASRRQLAQLLARLTDALGVATGAPTMFLEDGPPPRKTRR